MLVVGFSCNLGVNVTSLLSLSCEQRGLFLISALCMAMYQVIKQERVSLEK